MDVALELSKTTTLLLDFKPTQVASMISSAAIIGNLYDCQVNFGDPYGEIHGTGVVLFVPPEVRKGKHKPPPRSHTRCVGSQPCKRSGHPCATGRAKGAHNQLHSLGGKSFTKTCHQISMASLNCTSTRMTMQGGALHVSHSALNNQIQHCNSHSVGIRELCICVGSVCALVFCTTTCTAIWAKSQRPSTRVTTFGGGIQLSPRCADQSKLQMSGKSDWCYACIIASIDNPLACMYIDCQDEGQCPRPQIGVHPRFSMMHPPQQYSIVGGSDCVLLGID
jgi:hypothetical protein